MYMSRAILGTLAVLLTVACGLVSRGWAQGGAAPPFLSRQPENARELVMVRHYYDQTVWSDEVEAQRHETFFVSLWDRLIHEPDKYRVLADAHFEQLLVGGTPRVKELDWGIRVTRYEGQGTRIPAHQWLATLDDLQNAGYRIIETEWHHSQFEPGRDGPNRSTVAVVLHVTNDRLNTRYIVKGDLKVEWADSQADVPVPGVVDATGLRVYQRKGTPAYTEQHREEIPTDETGKLHRTTIHPVILNDLNDDGLPEVIFGGVNRVLWNEGDWKFRSEVFCRRDPGHVNAGVIADFTGDGIKDYLCAVKSGWPQLYVGAPGGRFTRNPRRLLFTRERLLVPVTIAVGDIDGDGDLDVLIGQQKPGYINGEIATPYYNALDSYPSYLLENDGQGNFRDVTATSGLREKMRRRVFSASFVDLDNDGDLDLVLTSDFAGADVFLNDGSGYFTDISDSLQPKAYAFGMSHTFGDYNLDGELDFFIIGMSSTTARRLTRLNLGREEFPEYNARRMDMGYGNRMYLGGPSGFQQAPFNDTVARTGWSWGSTTLDFDNDGDPDLYVVNGQTSGKTTRDYCTRFWCHDVYYKEGERPDKAVQDLFGRMQALFTGEGISWNGYEHNALLMNLDGKGFVNVGFLMDVSSEYDSRMAVSGDLDGDGRVDILFEHNDLRNKRQNVLFLRNQWDQPHHWIGVHLRQQPGTASPIGAKVVATLADGRRLLRHNVAGHSVWAQHADTIHFGLGTQSQVESLEITWPNGQVTRLEQPEVDQYHVVVQ